MVALASFFIKPAELLAGFLLQIEGTPAGRLASGMRARPGGPGQRRLTP